MVGAAVAIEAATEVGHPTDTVRPSMLVGTMGIMRAVETMVSLTVRTTITV